MDSTVDGGAGQTLPREDGTYCDSRTRFPCLNFPPVTLKVDVRVPGVT